MAIVVTLDTNIYVSALQFGGAPMALLAMALDNEIEIAISQPILTETLRVLREKFRWLPYDILDAGQRLERIGRMVQPTLVLNVIEYDPPDNRILECAVESGSRYIVSHDKDLLRLASYRGIEIVTVADFLNRRLVK
jgi:putative PIN family toxin of toxin-antitoxin system